MSCCVPMHLIQRAFLRMRGRPARFLIRPMRRLFWSLQGMRVGPRSGLPRLAVTWPHQVQIGSDCILEDDIYFKFDGKSHQRVAKEISILLESQKKQNAWIYFYSIWAIFRNILKFLRQGYLIPTNKKFSLEDVNRTLQALHFLGNQNVVAKKVAAATSLQVTIKPKK